MQKKFKEFKEKNRYLATESLYYKSPLIEVKILEISDKAIKVDFGNKGITWFLKEDFYYKPIEELPTVKQLIEDRSHEIQFKDDWEDYDTEEIEREPFWEIKDLVEVQKESALLDDYNLGLYNGMELCLALLEKREPKYKDIQKSKLEWEQNPFKRPMSWYQAMIYIDSLGDGWRLPTIEELRNAYNIGAVDFQKNFYWSSSMYTQETTNAWYMSFYDGYVHHNNKNYRNHVRCVREVK